VLAPIDQVAKARGLGQFNPPPLFEQSTNRGKAYMNAFSLSGLSNESMPVGSEESNYSSEPQSLNDQFRNTEYKVGSTGMHDEVGNWNRKEFQGADNQYVQWALKALVNGGITPTPMITFFFSTDNVDYIQSRIKTEVKKNTGTDIADQSIDELLIIMRNAAIYGYSGWLPSNSNGSVANSGNLTNRGEQACSLEEKISRLNKSVIEEAVKQVFSGINQYKLYYKDQSSLPMPLSLPVYTSMSGSRELSESIGFNSGLERSVAAQSFNQRYNII
jgi:hypothetical protein